VVSISRRRELFQLLCVQSGDVSQFFIKRGQVGFWRAKVRALIALKYQPGKRRDLLLGDHRASPLAPADNVGCELKAVSWTAYAPDFPLVTRR
jgi:hypothetical protein